VTAIAAPTVISLDGVSAGYGLRPVLDAVDLRIGPGARLALIGPNGAGKSTLLRVIAGTIVPSAGSVSLEDRPIGGLDRAAIARRLAVVPQGASLPFSMRVEEVVGLGRLPHEDPFRGHRPADRAAVAAAIERVGLVDLVGRDARELSLGERQLVLVAMAIAQDARILLLDEPTVHLDLRHQVDILDLLRDLNERDGVTIVAVLHDVGLAARTFPRLVLLDHGRMVADGAPDDVLAPELVRTVFGVDPSYVRLPTPA
jgi:iron complex transport system ATP-binding protein